MKSSLISNVGIVMKLIYIKPEIEVIDVRDDIIVTSGPDDTCDNFDNNPTYR